jgi:putative membrane protein
MAQAVAYCGTPPLPGELAGRFNFDPVLIAGLVFIIFAHIRHAKQGRSLSLLGWSVAALAVISPLCALSVSLFSARVAQHMMLVLIAAPLIAVGLPGRTRIWPATIAFFLALWTWHLPAPYDATLQSTPVYWAMHLSLFGSSIWLWRGLIHHSREEGGRAIVAGLLTSMQMGLLGAVLTLASYPLFRVHLFTTEGWGLTPLADQQLGGVLMWVPGMGLFLWLVLRSAAFLWQPAEAQA